MTAFRAVTAQTPGGWLAVAHPRRREKALKAFGWLCHRSERIVDARLNCCGAACKPIPARLGRREGTVPGTWGRVLRHPCPDPLPIVGT